MNDEDKNNNEEEILEDEVEVVEEEALQDKLKKLRADLKTCQSEKADYLAGWQRAKADFINARRDEEKARGEFAKYAAEKVLREMLVVADSLGLSGNAECKTVLEQLNNILKREGVAQIESIGLIFNPMYHEALGEVETKNKDEDNVILDELQKGYMLYDRVLRPSKVKVGVFKN